MQEALWTAKLEKMSVLKYPWQQFVSDAFLASPQSAPSKVNIAERAIAARLIEQTEPDIHERLALKDALRSLQVLIRETRTRGVHYHIRWAQIPLLDWEAFKTRVDAEAAATILARIGEKYRIEEQGEGCQRCRDAAKAKSLPLARG